MQPADDVTHWLDQLKAGDRAAVDPLWAEYFHQVLRLAGQRLRSAPRLAGDAEDVAVSAFASFCRAAEDGRLPRLTDRHSLWSHLFVYTIRKAHDLVKREYAAKRGGGTVVTESGLRGPDDGRSVLDVLGREPDPELAALVAEEYRAMLARLPSDDFRAVAQWDLEGYTNDEIAAKLGCSRRRVERMVRIIRDLWAEEGDQS